MTSCAHDESIKAEVLEVDFVRFRLFEKAGLVGRAKELHGGEGGIILREPFAGHELACEEERIVVRVEPLGLGPSSSVENRNSLACLPG